MCFIVCFSHQDSTFKQFVYIIPNEIIKSYNWAIFFLSMVTRLKKWLNLAQILAKLLFIKFFY